MGVTPEDSGNGRPPSGYARHVGRVGGLAFALGVGAALLTGTAVASAETSESSSVSASASASDSPSDSSTQRQSAKPQLGSRTTAERPDRSDSEDPDSRDSDSDSEAEDGTSTRNSKQDRDAEPRIAVSADDAEDAAVDTVGSAAAQTIDSIVAAVGGAPTPAAAVTPVPAMPVGNQAAATPVREPEPQQLAYATTAASPPQAPKPPAAVAPANDTRLVSEIQRGLASLGFYRGSIDGHPGEATARAIREFENFHRYRVTGEIKPDLIELLRQAGAPV